MSHDLLVIGAGAGGLSAARAGVRARLATALVTDGPIGGDCTFTGCVPSKTLLAAAAAGASATDALARVRATVARVAATETPEALRDEGVDVVEGRARFAGPGALVLDDGRTLAAPRIVLATGATPLLPDLPGLAAADPLTTDTVFDLDGTPGSLIVLGAGPAGCELAQAFARLGTAVTLVDRADRVLPGLDADVSAVVADALRREGVDVRLGTGPADVEALGDGRLRLHDVEADRLLVVTGRRPATADLDLDRAGIGIGADGAVVINDHLATTTAGVFAVGDVAGTQHTHAADEMGRIAVANAGRPAWRRRRFRPHLVPRVVFTDPEVATIGLSESEAGPDAWVAEIPMSAVDRAVTAGREEGFVRLVAGPPPGTRRLTRDGLRKVGGGRLVGATIVAERAGEMIAEVGLAMRTGALTGRLAQTVHAYPTWSLAVRQAAAALATGASPGVTVRRAVR
ncbi:FAD-dependent oxidoreductase [Actinomycetospora endophytica]|uniref:FAD-dependent oxidoreductase n=1 Tax=Actinomycetospora endophytica TaxID=2291215 RepID=A0ABS8P645_9PSEU|nr:FAD-dependent oxidoreductase [Actinomycetospora endophytica]MCD2193737.1 FAD-dependent oxidoreductase [Actinomycetospora endophytica]